MVNSSTFLPLLSQSKFRMELPGPAQHPSCDCVKYLPLNFARMPLRFSGEESGIFGRRRGAVLLSLFVHLFFELSPRPFPHAGAHRHCTAALLFAFVVTRGCAAAALMFAIVLAGAVVLFGGGAGTLSGTVVFLTQAEAFAIVQTTASMDRGSHGHRAADRCIARLLFGRAAQQRSCHHAAQRCRGELVEFTS